MDEPLLVIHPADVARYEEVFGPVPVQWTAPRGVYVMHEGQWDLGWTEPDRSITRLVFPEDATVRDAVRDAVEAACRG